MSSLFVGVHIMRALLFGVYISAPDFQKLSRASTLECKPCSKVYDPAAAHFVGAGDPCGGSGAFGASRVPYQLQNQTVPAIHPHPQIRTKQGLSKGRLFGPSLGWGWFENLYSQELWKMFVVHFGRCFTILGSWFNNFGRWPSQNNMSATILRALTLGALRIANVFAADCKSVSRTSISFSRLVSRRSWVPSSSKHNHGHHEGAP